eukprot:TRINITY_DN8512_c1_g1_i2.p1 TRINITY_DN8512_c1_g1~~TRINITY_DN8512_c1_g1_i2.p1  ORF type:complete len:114 (-),score=7.61 TRINITY_DN8512_c1_g1_i2:166-507(-)
MVIEQGKTHLGFVISACYMLKDFRIGTFSTDLIMGCTQSSVIIGSILKNVMQDQGGSCPLRRACQNVSQDSDQLFEIRRADPICHLTRPSRSLDATFLQKTSGRPCRFQIDMQ